MPKWEGFKNNTSKLNNSLYFFINLNQFENISSLNYELNSDNWTNYDKNSEFFQFQGLNYAPYLNATRKLFNEMNEISDKDGKVYTNNNKLFYDRQNPDNKDSIVGGFINEVNVLGKELIDKYEVTKKTLFNLFTYKDSYNNSTAKIYEKYNDTFNDLNNYKTNFLNDVEYYIKVGKGCGHILVMVYLSILTIISIIGGILLMVYSLSINQKNMDIIMHIIWNSVRFFSFSFMMYGAAFGMLNLGLKDAISYNQYLFGKDNLAEENKTQLLPEGNSKEFLRFCLTEEKTDYFRYLDYNTNKDLRDFYNNYNSLNSNLNSTLNKGNIINYNKDYSIKQKLRNLDPLDSGITDTSKISDSESDSIVIPDIISLPINEINSMLMELRASVNQLEQKISISTISNNTNDENYLESFDCGFLKNDLSMVYNTLYDLSTTSQILCALSCCLGFFGEILAHFYILSMYHYNNNEFTDGKFKINKSDRSKNMRRNIDSSSRNFFLDKIKPKNMEKFNKDLDYKYNNMH